MNIKEQVLSLKIELEKVKRDALLKKETQEKLEMIKKQNKALLHSLIFVIVAFFILLIYTLSFLH